MNRFDFALAGNVADIVHGLNFEVIRGSGGPRQDELRIGRDTVDHVTVTIGGIHDIVTGNAGIKIVSRKGQSNGLN